MFDTLMKLDENREALDFYATDKRAIEELLNREKFKILRRKRYDRRRRYGDSGILRSYRCR